jgi:hypothetical protein
MTNDAMQLNPTLLTLDQLAALSDRDARMLLVEAQAERDETATHLRLVKAEAEQRVIDAAGGDPKALGSNDAARERALTIALSRDADYQTMLDIVQQWERAVARLAAEIEARADARRAQARTDAQADRALRVRLIELLERADAPLTVDQKVDAIVAALR